MKQSDRKNNPHSEVYHRDVNVYEEELMDKKAVLLDKKDNVATCTVAVQKGDMVSCHGGGEAQVTASMDIPIWHKIALQAIPKGDMVYKYGEVIGKTLADIPQGGWVSHENLYSVPWDYASEYIKGQEVQ